MKPIIEFCANNAGFGTDVALNRLKEHYDCEVIEYGCLTGCGMCYMSPYALVNGETVAAETAEQLYEVIVDLIKEIEAIE
ncbi:YuzB family protein [Fontibacillus sp. BL9]|uniref:YuzB family protein n=1 Tax=Fontibacillus sp. BL9 TaxID=3389971 RepID=UPI00397C3866